MHMVYYVMHICQRSRTELLARGTGGCTGVHCTTPLGKETERTAAQVISLFPIFFV